jgi:prevent-host-death family protein
MEKEPFMKEHSISISEAQNKITQLPEQFGEEPEAVTVTRHGKPVMAILPFNTYRSLLEQLDTALEKLEAIEETLEILHDEELMASFREGVQELAEGKGRPWEDVKKELGLE